MTEYKAAFIKIPTDTVEGYQTLPVEPHKRLKEEEIYCTLCEPSDAGKIAEGLYKCFPPAFWDRKEPPDIREPHQPTRERRLTERIRPTFLNPYMKWVKAVHAPTNQIIAVAGWMAPGNPVHGLFRKDAVQYYGWQEKMGWSDADIEEMWKGVSIEAWDGTFAKDDKLREELMKGEPHWHLATFITWPEWQGRGAGTKLMMWAIEQADKTDPVTPMYLESAPSARAVYMRFGFKPQGAINFLRRGPAIVTGLEAEEAEGSKTENADVSIVEKETDANLAS